MKKRFCDYIEEFMNYTDFTPEQMMDMTYGKNNWNNMIEYNLKDSLTDNSDTMKVYVETELKIGSMVYIKATGTPLTTSNRWVIDDVNQWILLRVVDGKITHLKIVKKSDTKQVDKIKKIRVENENVSFSKTINEQKKLIDTFKSFLYESERRKTINEYEQNSKWKQIHKIIKNK